MRNAFRKIGSICLTALGVGLLGGCVSQPKAGELDQARDALITQNYLQAQTAADTYLAREPNGSRAAEAFYLKGRALEDAPTANLHEARENLKSARMAYISALKVGTSDHTLEGMIRASLADVAYWQDDFATAAEQWLSAYPMLDDASAKSWTLYRAGISQQRMGRFEDADRTLAAVMQEHPGTEPAQRASTRVGVRGFNVQVATYAKPVFADQALTTLGSQGFKASKREIAGGKTVILVGPFPTYGQAIGARQRMGSIFPDALIVP